MNRLEGWCSVRPNIVVIAILATAGCKFPELPPVETDGAAVDASGIDASADADDDATPGPTYSVGGAVTGMWTGAAVVLEISAPPAAPERTTVSTNGTFSFPTELPAGRSFTIAVATNGEPFMHSCSVLNANGMVVDSDIMDRQVTCAPQITMSVAFTAPLVIPFDVTRTSYLKIETPTLVQESRVSVTAPSASTLSINGVGTTSGGLSGVLPLSSGIAIHVAVGAISQDYTFTFDLGGGGDVLNGPVYAKSSNSGMGDQQGAAVSASGNLVAVGAPLEDSNASGVNQNQNNESSADSGAVYIYRRVGLAWTQEAYLKASTNQADARFGTSVSLHNEGNTAILAVGAPKFDGTGGTDSGAVHIFRRSAAGVWTEEQRVEPAPTGKEFGASVSINRVGGGYALAVGAPRYGTDHGAAYVFRYNGSVWNQEKWLIAPNTEPNDRFGSRVSMYGSVLAVGAPGEDSNGVGVNPAAQANNSAPDSGAVYLYAFAANDWSLTTYLKASNTGAGDAFGSSLSVENNVLVVGAPGEDSDGTNQANNSASEAGAAYVFEFSAGAWSQLNYLKVGTNLTTPEFGGDVCVHSGMVLVGATERLGSAGATGAARYFVRGVSTGFDFGSSLFRAANADEGDAFATSVSISGEGIFIGAPSEDSNARGFGTGPSDNGAADSGAVYGYY
jgi:hypothetical protein